MDKDDDDFAKKVAKESSALAAEMMFLFMTKRASKAASTVACARILAVCGMELEQLKDLVEAAYREMTPARELMRRLEIAVEDGASEDEAKEVADKIIADLMVKHDKG